MHIDESSRLHGSLLCAGSHDLRLKGLLVHRAVPRGELRSAPRVLPRVHPVVEEDLLALLQAPRRHERQPRVRPSWEPGLFTLLASRDNLAARRPHDLPLPDRHVRQQPRPERRRLLTQFAPRGPAHGQGHDGRQRAGGRVVEQVPEGKAVAVPYRGGAMAKQRVLLQLQRQPTLSVVVDGLILVRHDLVARGKPRLVGLEDPAGVEAEQAARPDGLQGPHPERRGLRREGRAEDLQPGELRAEGPAVGELAAEEPEGLCCQLRDPLNQRP
mmetsp:Transcript_117014/g.342716  ORF Transcript_117014/g.342716 Transcript_117014/m.342716 type:complete len:271 (-) Transcript_117014:139-951(-)